MALLFRAIWKDDTPDLHEWAIERFESWVRGKHRGEWQVPTDGAVVVDELPPSDVTLQRASGNAGSIQRAALHEDADDARWTTTLTTTKTESGPGSIWVDVERVAEDPFGRFDIAAPRLVPDLIAHGVNPRRGPLLLTTRPTAVRPSEVDALVDLLCDPGRDLPVVVFTKRGDVSGDEWVETVKRASEKLAASAAVRMLPPDAVDPFINAAGRDLAVWGGALRVYLPGFSLDEGRAWRHRFVLPQRLIGPPSRPGILVNGMLSRFLASQRAPVEYAKLRVLLSQKEELDLDEIENWLAEKDDEIGRLADQVERLEIERDEYLSDFTDASEQLNILQRNYRLTLAEVGQAATLDDAFPASADACSTAVDHARQWLEGVVIPEGAIQDLDDLDQAMESTAWGETAWRALQALDAYAQTAGDFNGGFWEWCSSSGDPMVWPASQKKLAMSESETVMNNQRLRDKRIFPIATVVDPSGSLLMQAHIKIAEGGGGLAPRIYFYDDTKGPTGKVHVGYFGPHRNLPNTKT